MSLLMKLIAQHSSLQNGQGYSENRASKIVNSSANGHLGETGIFISKTNFGDLFRLI